MVHSTHDMDKASASANELQVGGSHYKVQPGKDNAFQHWNVFDEYCGYMEGYASKYVVRWRTAGKPVQDLTKSLHIVQRLIERNEHEGRHPRMHVTKTRFVFGMPANVMSKFLEASGVVNELDRQILIKLGCWVDSSDLRIAMDHLKILLSGEAKMLQAKIDANKTPMRGQASSTPSNAPGVDKVKAETIHVIAVHDTPVFPKGSIIQLPLPPGFSLYEKKKPDGQEHPFGYDAEQERQ